ncbi:hypothetical protein CLCOS_06640 [Clostridium coskatii]|uniref:Integrase catalytic domain-containing protein n=1 Tax=Clostridium coskatii TaxID=1705578 RepID=A0A162NAL2_9CLOT|nr:hypothetical protein WX73_01941 [Clostridium coskatii]OBR97070.1 hypothetical protein CLCOS_06640 [Clostridium coskatii]
MECEWLYGNHFKTREEARAAVFEYVEIFYNKHSNGYVTPEKYYNNSNKKIKNSIKIKKL